MFLLFSERIELVRQIAKRHANDRNDDIGDGRPPLEDFDKELQAEIVDKDIADSHKEIPDNLCPTTQGGAWKTNVSRHPETRQESDGEFEHESGNMGRESNETKVKHLGMKYIVVEYIV